MAIQKNGKDAAPVAKKAPAKVTPIKKAETKATPAAIERVSRQGMAQEIRNTAIANGMAMPLKLALIAVAAYEDAVIKALKAGNEVVMPGFGKFSVARREERTGRNPSTGETITIAAKNVPVFKAGATLKDAVN